LTYSLFETDEMKPIISEEQQERCQTFSTDQKKVKARAKTVVGNKPLTNQISRNNTNTRRSCVNV